MYTVPSVLRTESTQTVTPAVQSAAQTTGTTASSEFSSLMSGILSPDKENNVNEEELFAALVQQRIYSLKGQAAGDSFKTTFAKHKAENAGMNGYCFFEQAARNALKDFQGAGGLTVEEADKIHAEAFEAAQLDDNKTALFDGIGGPTDPTKAVAQMQSALAGAEALLKKFETGEVVLPTHLLNGDYPALGTEPLRSESLGVSGGVPGIGAKVKGDFTPKNFRIDGNEGMLWKPHSHTTGKLIMLLPPSYTGQVSKITLRSEETGAKLDAGKYFSVGVGPTGREKWVFKRPGEKYPDNVKVEIQFKDGNVRTMHIAKPGKRYE